MRNSKTLEALENMDNAELVREIERAIAKGLPEEQAVAQVACEFARELRQQSPMPDEDDEDLWDDEDIYQYTANYWEENKPERTTRILFSDDCDEIIRSLLVAKATEIGLDVVFFDCPAQCADAGGETEDAARVYSELCEVLPPEEDLAVVREVYDAWEAEGPDAFLWLHTSGDCILWPSEDASIDDNGSKAVERWQLTEEQYRIAVLLDIFDELA